MGYTENPKPVSKFIQTLGVSSRDERVRLVASHFCAAPERSNFLQTTYGYSPDQFVDLFASAYSRIHEVLPEQFLVDFQIEGGKFGALNISNWIVSQATERAVTKDLRLVLEHKAATYKIFFDHKVGYYNSETRGLPSVAFFGYSLGRLADDEELEAPKTGIIIEELTSGLTNIKTRKEISSMVPNITEAYPVPLRWSEGARTSLADGIRKMEEELVGKIGQSQGHTAILVTTPPSEDGAKMLDRQGYVNIDRLVLPATEMRFLKNSFMYQRANERRHRAKAIYIPE